MKMKLDLVGTSTLVKVLGLTPHGMWFFAEGEEHFLSYEEFPWFKDAPVKSVFHVEQQGRSGFCWPDLDVDLSMDGIKHPERYPLIAKY